ncbi:MAG: di-trans,poly-cis-decaprenylcistransferase [Bifidobacteriaceae bacterium]|jgi:undecaprenyl diphosphate synthase|nr:di-trans,poly-cis-decaprenylcistransferase [Bifidobacteriaceae bacterium]
MDHPQAPAPGAVPPGVVPRHVAVVMDGNGRWAKERGLPRTEGHRAGEEALVEVVAGAIEAGVEWLSVYAFSTENWRRSPSEVRFLMGYSRRVLRARRDLFHSWNVRVRWAGQAERLWPSVIRELREAEQLTVNNTGLQLVLCVNYGGRAEIISAAKSVMEQGGAAALSEASLSQAMSTPDVDLFWRTSGEARLSNFLIWEAAYAELVFTDKLWPDVTRQDLWSAIDQYGTRERRYGRA